MTFPQRSIGITVLTSQPAEWGGLYELLASVAKDLEKRNLDYISVHSTGLDEKIEIVDKDYSSPLPGEYFDEDTMRKVRQGLHEALPELTESQINEAIRGMQYYGILFRERR